MESEHLGGERHKVTIIDPLKYVVGKPGADAKKFQERQNAFILKKLGEEKPSFVGLYLTNQFERNIELVKSIREKFPSMRIIAGGPGPIVNPDAAFRALRPDAMLAGEAELVNWGKVFGEVEKLWDPNASANVKNAVRKRLRDVPGLIVGVNGKMERVGEFLPDGHVRHTTRKDLERVKVRWESVEDYFNHNADHVSLLISRGCPYGCTFCTKPHGTKHRRRSVDSVIEELKALAELKGKNPRFVGIRKIKFGDDNFFLRSEREWVLEFCDKAKKAKLPFTFECMGNPTSLVYNGKVDTILINKLKEAGVTELQLGTDSLVEAHRNRMSKPRISQNNLESLILELDKRFSVDHFIIFADFKSSVEEILEHVNKLKHLSMKTRNSNFLLTDIAVPTIDTALHKIVKREAEKDGITDDTKKRILQGRPYYYSQRLLEHIFFEFRYSPGTRPVVNHTQGSAIFDKGIINCAATAATAYYEKPKESSSLKEFIKILHNKTGLLGKGFEKNLPSQVKSISRESNLKGLYGEFEKSMENYNNLNYRIF
ncbi:radical SAM protein [Candidatus Micrarchaeota archaeon]|nr:radical SAM protein [Candidatus Micrarchaeota archaeon]MBU1939881.1 radical SAM protein [Candidatus Micrarchaeota archaeon]